MRLFIAISFSADVKDRLTKVITALKSQAQRGSFTLRDNLHLTLAFIGETRCKDDIIKIMQDISAPGCEILLEGFGCFKRGDGDIYWIGVRKNAALNALQQELCGGLLNSGFEIDRREFNPHLTLGRRVVLSDNFNRDKFICEVPAITVPVNKISLMKSERINGKLTYTEIYARTLREQL